MPGGMSFAYPLGWKFPEPPRPPHEPLWRIFLALIAEEVRNWRKFATCRLLDHDYATMRNEDGVRCCRCGKRWP